MRISKIRKSFPGFSLDIESMDIAPGHIYGLIGPNGCGKSTLTKILAGVLPPDGGSLDFGGITPREITMLTRKPYMLHDTVLSNLVYPLKLRKTAPRKEIADYWLELTGLSDKRTQYAPNLSGGEQQKLALARALIFDPKLILLDEGLSNMDIESIAQVEKLIRARQETAPVTWIIVSHQLSHIERMCEYVFFMDGGRLGACGDMRSMLFSPKDEALIRYLRFEGVGYNEAREL